MSRLWQEVCNVKYIRGWIGAGVFAVGVVMACFEATRRMSWLALGFGMGMMSSGF